MRSRTIYILPTRSCVPLGAVLLAIAYAAVSQNNAGAYLLGFCLIALGIISMVHTHFALTGLRARVGLTAPTFAGSLVRVPVYLENGSRRTRRAIFRVARAREWRWPWQRRPQGSAANGGAVGDGPGPDGAAGPPVTDAPLAGSGTLTLLLLVPVGRRGREPFGRLVVSTLYPLGFFRGLFFEAMPEVDLLVYPAPVGVRPLPAPPSARVGPEEFLADRPAGAGTGDDYTGSRPYRPGDSQRHVDWRAAARGVNADGGNGLLVKQFAGTTREVLILDWTMLDDLGEDVEARLCQLCRWLLDAENSAELPYGLRLPGGFVLPAGRGEAHLHRGLRALALHGEPGAGGGSGS